MIAAGTGLAIGGTVDNAALDAALEAVERSQTDRADLAFVFVTGDAYSRAHEALHAVRRVTGARIVLGCSGSGILTERREVEAGLAVAVLTVRVRAARGHALRGSKGKASARDLGTRALRSRIGATVAEGGCALVLPDAMGCNPAALLAQLHEALGFVPVLGAVSAGAPMFELYNTEPAQGALVGIALSGLAPLIGVAQGCTPIGEPSSSRAPRRT